MVASKFKIPFPVGAQGEHAFIVGKTGSGKTYLANRLIGRANFIACLDTKRTMNIRKDGAVDWWNQGYKFFSNFDEMIEAARKGWRRVVYQPDQTEFKNRAAELERYDEFFHWVYTRGNTLVYVDEAFMICDGNNIPRYYRACLTQGRELGISCYASSQRPVSISQLLLSEMSHIYAFKLAMSQDREKLANTLGYDVEFLLNVPKHRFYYLSELMKKGHYKVN